MTSIVIAEKPSQARDYERAIGRKFGDIYAARGHLFELADPEQVNPEWKTWRPILLRPESGFYPTVLKNDKDARNRYIRIRKAARSANTIYIATDPDREGQGIGGNILAQLRREIGWDGRVLRVLPLATDTVSLRQAFENARPGDEFRALYQSFLARSQADKMFGFSLTRTASVTLKPDGWRGAMSVGRVFTPTLGIVCAREEEIASFVPQTYWHPWVDVAGEAGTARLTYAPPEQDRIFDKAKAEAIAATAGAYAGPIAIQQQRKRQAPPKLFSLSQLQLAASRRLKWDVKKTADVLQSLYQAELTTYPRSSECSLPEAEIENAPTMLAAIKGLPWAGEDVFPGSDAMIRRKAGAFSDADLRIDEKSVKAGKEKAAHYAIVPNIQSVDQWAAKLPKLSRDQAVLFEIVARRYLAAISPDRVYDATKASIVVQKTEFSATGTVEVEPGFRCALGMTGKEDEESKLPPFRDRDQVRAVATDAAEKVTAPPPRFSEATLAEQMIEAWKLVPKDQGELRAMLKDTDGIGTEATRGDVIDRLKKTGFVIKATGSGSGLAASEAGLQFYRIQRDITPELLDVGMTGRMEMLLEKVKRGEAGARSAVDQILQIAERAIGAMVDAEKRGLKVTAQQDRAPTTKMKVAAKAKAKAEGKNAPPRGVLSSFQKCREYLGPVDSGPKDRQRGQSRGRGPSEKQLSYARSIAEETGKELPESACASGDAISKWIDEHKPNKQSGGGSRKTPGRGARKAEAE
tara:strand:+ start:8376 stop:10622 length:2247 start_codon:yes stop_codon:yes gene_type:complete